MKSARGILYDGPSAWNCERIVMIATDSSKNVKTGALIQTFIIRPDAHPWTAIQSGMDVSICGECPFRRNPATGQRTCYVRMDSVASVWRAYQRGSYGPVDVDAFRGRKVRLGTYGDPAMVPFAAIAPILAVADSWTGYTHQWRHEWAADYRSVCMASVGSLVELCDAESAGWRAYIAESTVGSIRADRAIGRCPASAEQGHRMQCADCMACNGCAITGRRRAHMAIVIHGPGARHAA